MQIKAEEPHARYMKGLLSYPRRLEVNSINSGISKVYRLATPTSLAPFGRRCLRTVCFICCTEYAVGCL